ncbi:MAG: J domain-containing protein [Pseudomonadota bacterium]
MRDPYSIVGLDSFANQAEIKHAVRLRAKLLHPDANPGDPVAEAAFGPLTEAYGAPAGEAVEWEKEESGKGVACQEPDGSWWLY